MRPQPWLSFCPVPYHPVTSEWSERGLSCPVPPRPVPFRPLAAANWSGADWPSIIGLQRNHFSRKLLPPPLNPHLTPPLRRLLSSSSSSSSSYSSSGLLFCTWNARCIQMLCLCGCSFTNMPSGCLFKIHIVARRDGMATDNKKGMLNHLFTYSKMTSARVIEELWCLSGTALWAWMQYTLMCLFSYSILKHLHLQLHKV